MRGTQIEMIVDIEGGLAEDWETCVFAASPRYTKGRGMS